VYTAVELRQGTTKHKVGAMVFCQSTHVNRKAKPQRGRWGAGERAWEAKAGADTRYRGGGHFGGNQWDDEEQVRGSEGCEVSKVRDLEESVAGNCCNNNCCGFTGILTPDVVDASEVVAPWWAWKARLRATNTASSEKIDRALHMVTDSIGQVCVSH